MAYTGNGYVTADLDDIVADGLGTAGAAIVVFMTIIVLIGLLTWGWRKVKGAR